MIYKLLFTSFLQSLPEAFVNNLWILVLLNHNPRVKNFHLRDPFDQLIGPPMFGFSCKEELIAFGNERRLRTRYTHTPNYAKSSLSFTT